MTDLQVPNLTFSYDTQLAPPTRVFRFDGTARVIKTWSGVAADAFPSLPLTLTLWLRTQQSTRSVVLEYAGARNGSPSLTVADPSSLEITLGQTSWTTGVSITDGLWHHLALTLIPRAWGGVAATLAVDAVPVATNARAFVIPSKNVLDPAGTLTLGGAGNTAQLIADASELCIWGAALSPQQLLTWMRSRPAEEPSALCLHWALCDVASAGTITGGPPNPFADSELRFRTPLQGRSAYALARWTLVGASSYDLEIASEADGSVILGKALGGSSMELPSVLLGCRYHGRVRARAAAGEPGSWSATTSWVPLDLPVSTPRLEWRGGDSSLWVTWQSVAQASEYHLIVERVSPADAEPWAKDTRANSENISFVLDDAGGRRIVLQAKTDGSKGPRSDPGSMVPAPTLESLIYDSESGTVHMSWQSATGAASDLVCLRYGQGIVGWIEVPPTTVERNFTTGPLASNTKIIGAVRGLGTCTITDEASATVIVKSFPAPGLSAPRDVPSEHALDVVWSFEPATFRLSSAVYDVELRIGDGTFVPVAKGIASTSARIPYAPETPAGTILSVRVRAIADGNRGPFSAQKSVAIGSHLGQTTIIGFSFSTDNAMTISWHAVAPPNVGDQVIYSVSVKGDGIHSGVFPQMTPNTTITVSAEDSGVQSGKTYTATVTAIEPAPAGLPSAPMSKTAGHADKNDPPPVDPYEYDGDPYSLITGAFAYSHEDIAVEGVIPLSLVAVYMSDRGWPEDDRLFQGQPLGPRWNHTYNTRLCVMREASPPSLVLIWGNFLIVHYDYPTQIGPCTQRGCPNGDVLTSNADGTYTVERLDQSRYDFAADGRLMRIFDRHSNQVKLSYDSDGRLKTVADTGSGRRLSFDYEGDRLVSVTDAAGRQISYTYGGEMLAEYTGPDGGKRKFSYVGNGRLQAAHDENGNTIVENTFQNDGRISSQKVAPGGRKEAGVYTISWSQGDDGRGNATVIATQIDPIGNRTTHTSLADNYRVTSIQAALAMKRVRRTTRSYDGLGRLTNETVFEGDASTPAGQGNRTSYEYDGRGRPTKIILPGSVGSIRIDYDSKGNLKRTVGPFGKTTTYTFTEDNALKSVTKPDGSYVEYNFAKGPIRGLVTSITTYPADGTGKRAKTGNTTLLEYTPAGQVRKRTDPLGNVTTFFYDDATGWLLSECVQEPSGAELKAIDYDRDPHTGRVARIKVRFGNQPKDMAFVTEFGYDAAGNLTKRRDPNGGAWDFTYDEANYPTVECLPLLNGKRRKIQRLYDANHRVSQVLRSTMDEKPVTGTIYTYDELGRLRDESDLEKNPTSKFNYAFVSRSDGSYALRKSTTYPSAGGAVFTCEDTDALGRVVGFSLPIEEGSVPPFVTVDYAPATSGGKQVTLTWPAPSPGGAPLTETWILDAQERPLSYTRPNGNTWTWEYGVEEAPTLSVTHVTVTQIDPTGRKRVEVLDPLGRTIAIRKVGATSTRTRTIAYDALDRIVCVTEEPLDGSSARLTTSYSYTYDRHRNAIEQRVQAYGSPAATYVYDGLGQLIAYRDPQGVSGSYTYGGPGRMSSWTNGRNQKITYDFDGACRLTTATLPDGSTIAHKLDSLGNRVCTDWNGVLSIQRTFTRQRLLLTRKDAKGTSVEYTYTRGSLVATVCAAPGKTVTYRYDVLGRLVEVEDWAQRRTTYTYDPDGNVVGINHPTGVAVQNIYDAAGRLVESMTTTAGGSELITSTRYSYNDYGERASLDVLLPMAPGEASASRTFTYAADRMTAVGQDLAAYDADGNLRGWGHGAAASLLEYDALNRPVRLGEKRFAYDVDGLRTRVESLSGGSILTARYTHDIGGFRSPIVEQADPERAIDMWRAARIGNGAIALLPVRPNVEADMPPTVSDVDRVLASTTEGGGEPSRTTLYVHGLGLLGREEQDGTYYGYVFDPLGNAVAIVDERGTVVGTQVYGHFGQILGRAGVIPDPFGFVGEHGVMDDGDGFYFMRAREYSANLLRFSARDVLLGEPSLPQTLNRYAYVLGDPLRFVDPLGLGVYAVLGTIAAAALLVEGGLLILGGGGAAAGASPGAAGAAGAAGMGASMARAGRLAWHVGRGLRNRRGYYIALQDL